MLVSLHLVSLRDGKTFPSLESFKTRLQDYAFTQRFGLVVEQNDKQCIVYGIIKCNEIYQKLKKKNVNVQIPKFFSWIASIRSGSAHHLLPVWRFGQ